MRFELLDALSGRLLSPHRFQDLLLAKINGSQTNITWFAAITKIHLGCSLLFGLCVKYKKNYKEIEETVAFQGTTSWEARQMGLSVSWRIGLDLKTFLTACKNAPKKKKSPTEQTEKCFCQAGRISFTTTGGK